MIFSNHMAFPPPSSSSSPFILQNDHDLGHRHHHHHHDMMMMGRSMSFSGMMDHRRGFPDDGGNDGFNNVNHNACGGVGDDDLSDDGSHMVMLGEKKKRLSAEQVKALERSFESGNKLEPERKVQLAKSLGLQPRQVAIWFQNRRARWKTKQLERDYEVLKRQLEILKADNDALHAQNEKLHAELVAIKARDMNEAYPKLGKKPEGSYWSNGSEISCDINLDISRTSGINSLSLSSSSAMQCLKLEQSVQDDTTLCNIFSGGVDEHHGFWPWTVADQHQLHES